jgi:putative ABC transport system permease protein
MALGASASEVSRLILAQGMKPAIAGIVVGLIAAFAAARVLRSLLFGIAPDDPLTFAAVPILLLLVAAIASYLPAWRAARIDPTSTLRAD